ncbi:hypothetical protein DFH07DRAFT_765695 [Mycena maculata]|uniref:Uncharacterized protein n=1 Tax=Mycena maculata TaxID=230809 RepID=A0AAD7NXL4_9AGAR|nr:hypothetical protein DFH07DRAFT_765695 [Mycena maculata]
MARSFLKRSRTSRRRHRRHQRHQRAVVQIDRPREAPGSSTKGWSPNFLKISLKKPLVGVVWGLKKPLSDKGGHMTAGVLPVSYWAWASKQARTRKTHDAGFLVGSLTYLAYWSEVTLQVFRGRLAKYLRRDSRSLIGGYRPRDSRSTSHSEKPDSARQQKLYAYTKGVSEIRQLSACSLSQRSSDLQRARLLRPFYLAIQAVLSLYASGQETGPQGRKNTRRAKKLNVHTPEFVKNSPPPPGKFTAH